MVAKKTKHYYSAHNVATSKRQRQRQRCLFYLQALSAKGWSSKGRGVKKTLHLWSNRWDLNLGPFGLQSNALTTWPQGWVLARKHQCTTVITTMLTESSWTFPESYTTDDSWIMRSSAGGQRGDKRAHNSTTKMSFCTIIIRLCIALCDHDGACHQNLCSPFLRVVRLFTLFTSSGNHTTGSRSNLLVGHTHPSQSRQVLTLTLCIPGQTLICSHQHS